MRVLLKFLSQGTKLGILKKYIGQIDQISAKYCNGSTGANGSNQETWDERGTNEIARKRAVPRVMAFAFM